MSAWSSRERSPKRSSGRGRPPTIDREAVLETAIQLLDAEGVEALTMRRLASASSEGPSQQRDLRGAPDPERYPTLAAAAAAWTAAHDPDTYREDLGALIDALLADACHS